MDERVPALGGSGVLDDEDALRAAIRAVVDSGWECDAGRAVLEALQDRAPRWARALDARMGNQPDSTDPADVLRTAWLTVHTFGVHVAGSKSPWTYLWTTVRRALAVDNTEQACLSSGVLTLYRQRGETPPTAVRAGVDTVAWEDSTCQPASSSSCGDWSPALGAFVRVIVDAGGEERFWTDAVGRAVDVMADARHSYQEWALRRDPYLTGVLGLLPSELSALAALLIGRRRGDRAQESLLLALHQDLTSSADDVPRARERLTVLLSRVEHRAQRCPQVA
jgi:hypothetical protein